MHLRRLVVLLVTVTSALAACGSSGDSDSVAGSATVDGAMVAVGAAPVPGDAVGAAPVPGDAVGSISDAVEVAAGAPAQANAAACDVDRQTIGTAVELFAATTGADPTSEQDLVDAGILQAVMAGWDLASDGSIVPAPDGACL